MPGPTIRIVALPIGHPEDLSPRAREALRGAHRIFCEDTRKLRELAARVELTLSAKLMAIPGDREHEIDWEREANGTSAGDAWVLVSDAGTPVVNDPGRALIDFAFKRGWSVTALPGPSAPVLAWQWSGGFGLPFVFAGFAPKAKQAGALELEEFFARRPNGGTFAFFDTRHQVLITLDHLVRSGWGAQRLVVAREMTKTHEELVRGDVGSALAEFRRRLEQGDPVGELTLLLESPAAAKAAAGTPVLADLLTIRQAGPKAAAKVAARLTGQPVAEVYQRFVAGKDAATEE